MKTLKANLKIFLAAITITVSVIISPHIGWAKAQSQPDTQYPPILNTCFACHGANGKSNNDLWPNLAGQKTAYLVKQMQDFKDAKRSDPLMSPMAQNLTSKEMESLAAYFSKL
jgi:cytochrome c553